MNLSFRWLQDEEVIHNLMKFEKLSENPAQQGGFWYQLKSQKSRIGDSITDSAFRASVAFRPAISHPTVRQGEGSR